MGNVFCLSNPETLEDNFSQENAIDYASIMCPLTKKSCTVCIQSHIEDTLKTSNTLKVQTTWNGLAAFYCIHNPPKSSKTEEYTVYISIAEFCKLFQQTVKSPYIMHHDSRCLHFYLVQYPLAREHTPLVREPSVQYIHSNAVSRNAANITHTPSLSK